jgi:hypothetical protein
MLFTQGIYGNDDKIVLFVEPAENVDSASVERWTFNSKSRAPEISGHSFFDAPFEDSVFDIAAFQIIRPHLLFCVTGEVICPIDDFLSQVLDSRHL